MKKHILTIALALIPALFFAQSPFEKYEKNENVTSFIAGKKTFAMIAQTQLNSEDEKIRKGKEMLAGIESIQVYTTKSQAVAADMKSTVTAYSGAAGLEDLMQIRDKGKTVSIMVKQGATENIVTQLLVFVGSDKAAKNNDQGGSELAQQSVIVLVNGNFDMEDFSEMISGKSVTGDKQTDDAKLAEIKNALELKVSPNPASGVFYLNTDKPADVKIYDLSGRLVKAQAYTSAGISTAGLAPATYVAEITSGDMKQTQKIVIK